MNVPLLHLLLPQVFLDEDGLDFYKAHGLDEVLRKNQVLEFQHHDVVFKVPALGLLRPDLFLDDAGRAFVREYELDSLVTSKTPVRLLHRCAKLTEDNLCSIYPIRPKACRDFDCRTRADHEPSDHTFPLEFKR
jgi:Fe-S-cluster containining protein